MSRRGEGNIATILLILLIAFLLTLILHGLLKSRRPAAAKDDIDLSDDRAENGRNEITKSKTRKDTRQSGQIYDGVIHTQNPANETLHYHVYFPEREFQNERLPVLVCVAGLGAKGSIYRDDPAWRQYCDNRGFVMIAPSFRFDKQDWNNKQSFQYPKVWSGDALFQIIREVGKIKAVDIGRIYLFGFSAGAQFVHRFALLYPDNVPAAAAIAAGGYTYPSHRISTKFFIGVGQNDHDRLKRAKRFINKANALSIDARLHVMPGVGHRLNQGQVAMSMEFFRENY